MAEPLVVAVDGPGGSGKSTVARTLARRLGLRHLDTGAMYRAVTWLALQRDAPLDDATALTDLAEAADLTVGTDPSAPSIAVDGTDVSEQIRSRAVTNAVSAVAAVPGVRARLVAEQQAIITAEQRGIVVEGRDIGTVVAPDAAVKVFLTASPAERARRRHREWGDENADEATGLARTHDELTRRDQLDSGRAASPLRPAPDALTIDSTGLSVEEVVDRIVPRVDEAAPELAGRR